MRPETEIMKETPWSRIREQNIVNKELLEIVGSGKSTGSVPKETIAVSVTISASVRNRQSQISLRALPRGRMREMHRELKVFDAGVPVVECFDCHARITSQELATIHSVKRGILQNACSACPKSDADLEKSALTRIARLKYNLAKGITNGDKSAVAMLKSTRQLGWVFQDMEPPKLSSILRKSSNIRKPIRCVRFTEAVVRHAHVRDQHLSLEMTCPGDPHQRNTIAPKFGSLSQEETVWQERCAREPAWKFVKISSY